MKYSRNRLAFATALVLFASVFFAKSQTSSQEQEDLAKKTQPQQKALPAQPTAPQSGPGARFTIGEFTVIVDAKSATVPRTNPAAGSGAQAGQPVTKTGAGYSGQGHIVIKGRNIRVSFSGIVVAPVKQGQVPVATSGTVQGLPGAAAEYNLEGFRVRLETSSIHITPERANATAEISLVQARFMAAGTANSLRLTSRACATCELAYARLDMLLTARYSVREGLTWTDVRPPTPSVGLGGCR